MKKDTIQQEVLFVTTTTFSQRQLCEKDVSTNHHLSHKEQLEEACWNGLLDELLPEIMERSTSGKRLFLWHIRHGESLLQLELGESTVSIEKQFSIDPCYFPSCC